MCICVWVGVLCSHLLCFVLRVLFSNVASQEELGSMKLSLIKLKKLLYYKFYSETYVIIVWLDMKLKLRVFKNNLHLVAQNNFDRDAYFTTLSM
jgi:hypothetical protein